MAVNVSIAFNKGIRCITFMKDGYVIKKDYGKYPLVNTYSDIIGITKQALLQIKGYLNSTSCSDTEFVIECSNSIFVGWFDKLCAKEQYQTEFSELLELLNELPIRYRLVHKEKPSATQYLKYFSEEKIKSKLTGLDLTVEEE